MSILCNTLVHVYFTILIQKNKVANHKYSQYVFNLFLLKIMLFAVFVNGRFSPTSLNYCGELQKQTNFFKYLLKKLYNSL
ncbi:MAG TPA: hypothetical protein DEO32_05040 [Ruminococcaceae bacterium]|nr:hypothetical protein [Oscillospiraceae bacterium]